MAGVNIAKERGRVTGVDLVVLRGNHVYMIEKLIAPQLVNELFQNEVIDQDDITIITKEHDKGRKQGVEQMLKIIHESGPKAFDGFVKSLRMAGFTDMADRLHKEHRSRMLQQDETETQERVCVIEGRSSDTFNFAKLPPFPRINTDGRNTDEINTDGINTDVRKTVEDIVERWEDWVRKMNVWKKNRDDCLDKLLKWWEGKQYKNVDIFKSDVKEWREVLYKCLFSEVEVLDSFIEWIQFVCSQPDCLYISLYANLSGLYGVMLQSKDDLYTRIDVCKQRQDKVKVDIERCINRLNQIISDEGKDNTGTSKDNTFSISFSGYKVDLTSCYGYSVDVTSSKTHIVRIYKHLKL